MSPEMHPPTVHSGGLCGPEAKDQCTQRPGPVPSVTRGEKRQRMHQSQTDKVSAKRTCDEGLVPTTHKELPQFITHTTQETPAKRSEETLPGKMSHRPAPEETRRVAEGRQPDRGCTFLSCGWWRETAHGSLEASWVVLPGARDTPPLTQAVPQLGTTSLDVCSLASSPGTRLPRHLPFLSSELTQHTTCPGTTLPRGLPEPRP